MNDINHFSFLIENTEITLYFNYSQFVSCNDDFSYPHKHSLHEMFILIDGELFIESDFSTINMNNSDICIIPPLTYHSTYREKNIPTKRISMMFTYRKNETIETDFDFYGIISALSKKDSAPIRLSVDVGIIKNIVDTFFSGSSQSITKLKEAKIKNLLSLLFINFAETLSQEHPNPQILYSKSIEYYLRLVYLDNLLNEYLNEKNKFYLNISSISEKMFLSSRQLLNIISNEYNASLKKLNHENRIRLAKFLLMHFPEMSVSQISDSCSYSSPETLSIIFKKRYGVSPLKFKNSLLREE